MNAPLDLALSTRTSSGALLVREPLLSAESLPGYIARVGAACYPEDPPGFLLQVIADDPGVRRALGTPDARGEYWHGAFTRDIIHRPVHPAVYARLVQLLAVCATDVYMASEHRFAPALTPPAFQMATVELPDAAASLPGYPLLDAALSRQHIMPRTLAQYCPQCLATSTYHRQVWLCKSVSACVRHSVLLLDSCPDPDCSLPVTISAVARGLCKCGCSLAGATSIDLSGDEFGLFSQLLLHTWLLQKPPPSMAAGYRLPNEPASVLHHVAHGLETACSLAPLGWEHLHARPLALMGGEPDRLRADSAKERINVAHRFVWWATAIRALCEWPSGFHGFLLAYAHRREARPIQKNLSTSKDHDLRTPQHDLRSLYSRWLSEEWSGGRYDFVQQAANAHIVRWYSATPGLTRSQRVTDYPELRSTLDQVSAADAVRVLGVSVQTVERLVAAGRLAAVRRIRGPRQYTFLRQQDVERLRARWETTVDVSAAAITMGVSPAVVVGMANSKLLRAERGPGIDGGPWRFARADVSECLLRIHAHVTEIPLTGTGRQYIDPIQAARMMTTVGGNMAALMRHVAAGAVPAYMWETNALPDEWLRLSNLLFDASQIVALNKSIRQERCWLGSKETANILRHGHKWSGGFQEGFETHI